MTKLTAHLDVVVHLQQDRAGAGHVPVTLLQVLHRSVVEVVTVFGISGQSPSLSCQCPQVSTVTPLLLHLTVLLPEVGQLAEQPRQLQLTSSLLR